MQVQELPTKIVSSAFDLVRLPVVIVGEHLGPLAPDDVEYWAPRLGVDALEGVVKETMGSILRDDRMRAAGREVREDVERRRAAVRTDAVADALAAEADEELDARLEAVEAARRRAEEEAARRKQRTAQEGAARVRSVRKQAERREEAVERSAEQADAAIERAARVRRLDALDGEADALSAEQAAIAAEHRADALDDEIEQSRERRKRS